MVKMGKYGSDNAGRFTAEILVISDRNVTEKRA